MRKPAYLLVLLLLVSVVSFSQTGAVKAESKKIVVPFHHSTIQAAVDAASDGDTVFVKSGTYSESVSIDVAISLVGEDPATTTIIGDLRLNGTVVLIQHNNVNVTGFTIQPSAYSWTRRGVHLLHVSYCNVYGNVIQQNEEGIWLFGSSSNNITGNTVIGANFGGHTSCGISVHCSPSNWIDGNTVKDNKVGVSLDDSPDNTLCNNIITNNLYAGLNVNSDNNSILENTIEHNLEYGMKLLGLNNVLKGNELNNNPKNFDIDPKSRADFYNSKSANDVDSSNTIEGKPIIYWMNKQDQKVPEDAAFVVLVNCTNIIVENLNLSKNPVAILLVSTVNSKIANNSVEATDYVIFVHKSSGNTVANNFVFKGGIGIFLHYSIQNEVIGNTVTGATSGITLEFSDENILDGNIIFGGSTGIGFVGSNKNTVRKNVVTECEGLALGVALNTAQNLFYLNSFFNNTRNVKENRPEYTMFPTNIWDNGTVGNYWDDYSGTDSNGDGIGDTPYIIDDDNQDNYPLTEPYAIPEYPSLMPMLITLVAIIAIAIVYRRKLSKNNQVVT